MRKLIIDRKTWLRGETSGKSFLLRISDHKMCCMGSYLLTCGLPTSKIRDIGTPLGTSGVEGDPLTLPMEAHWLIEQSPRGRENSEISRRLMVINDDTNITDSTREMRITALFKEQDVEVEFIN